MQWSFNSNLKMRSARKPDTCWHATRTDISGNSFLEIHRIRGPHVWRPTVFGELVLHPSHLGADELVSRVSELAKISIEHWVRRGVPVVLLRVPPCALATAAELLSTYAICFPPSAPYPPETETAKNGPVPIPQERNVGDVLRGVRPDANERQFPTIHEQLELHCDGNVPQLARTPRLRRPLDRCNLSC